MDFRWPDCQWRDHFPKLAALEEELSQRPSVIASPKAIDDDETSNNLTASLLSFDDL
jgi:glutathione S-transferase